MRKVIKKLSIKNKRRKLLTLLFVINLFVKSPKLDYSTSNKVKNNNSLSLEIIHRPSRGGAVFEVDAFDMFKVVNNKFKTPTDNKYNPFSLYLLPPSPGVRKIPPVKPNPPIDKPPINFGTTSNAGLPLIKGQVKSENDFLYRHLKVDPVFVNRKNPNPLKDCFPVPNVETLTGNFKDSTINLNPNPFKSKKLDDSVPEVVFLLYKLKELAATKSRNILINSLASNNISSLINCVKTKAIDKNKINDYIVNYRNLNIDDVEIQNVYENYLQKLYKIIGCKNEVKLQEKLYDKELEILAEEYREELSNIMISDSFDEFPIFLSKKEIDRLVVEVKLKQKLDIQEAFRKCITDSPTNSSSLHKPTLINDPKHNLSYKNFTHDLRGNNYSISVGNEISRRSTFDGLTTEKLTFNKITGTIELFEIEFKQVQDKFYHAKDFGVDFPPTFNETYFNLINPKKLNLKRKYLAKTVPMEAVNEFRMAIKNHVLNESTDLIIGTHLLYPELPAYHFYNKKDGNNCFFYIDKENRVGNFVSGWNLTQDQRDNLVDTGNFYKK